MITNNTSQAHRAKLYGLSGDVKPVDLPNASTFFEIDTSKKYWFDASNSYWYLDKGSGSYALPKASASTLGGIKVGEGLSIDQDGVLSSVSSNSSSSTLILYTSGRDMEYEFNEEGSTRTEYFIDPYLYLDEECTIKASKEDILNNIGNIIVRTSHEYHNDK